MYTLTIWHVVVPNITKQSFYSEKDATEMFDLIIKRGFDAHLEKETKEVSEGTFKLFQDLNC
jgi:hypothetical protein